MVIDFGISALTPGTIVGQAFGDGTWAPGGGAHDLVVSSGGGQSIVKFLATGASDSKVTFTSGTGTDAELVLTINPVFGSGNPKSLTVIFADNPITAVQMGVTVSCGAGYDPTTIAISDDSGGLGSNTLALTGATIFTLTLSRVGQQITARVNGTIIMTSPSAQTPLPIEFMEVIPSTSNSSLGFAIQTGTLTLQNV